MFEQIKNKLKSFFTKKPQQLKNNNNQNIRGRSQDELEEFIKNHVGRD